MHQHNRARAPALLVVGALTASLAFAAGGRAYYHPDDVAPKSKRFGQVAESLGPSWDAASEASSKIGKALGELELGVALLGDAAPAEMRDRAEATRREVTGSFMMLQRHVDRLQDGYSSSFLDALKRALPAASAGREVVECASGGGSMAQRFGPGGGGSAKSCEGEDINGALAAAIDRDPQLEAALKTLNDAPWPTISVTPRAEAVVPLTGDAAYIQLSTVAEALIDARIQTRREAFEDALAPIEDGLDAGEAGAVAKGAALRTDWERGLASDGAVLRAALQPALVRASKGGSLPASVGLCANPPALGGCIGEDVTQAALPALRADRRLERELSKLSP